jgi:hypothetical protein
MQNVGKAFFMTLCLVMFASFASAYAVRGILDLRLETFKTPIPLEGQWGLHWGQLLSASDLFQSNDFVEFPHKWDGQVVGNDTLTAQGFATYRLKIILPSQPQDYEMFIDDMFCAYALYVDGMLIAQNGKVGVDLQHSMPEWKPMVVEMKNLSGSIELILQISNWRHSKGGAMNPILLSSGGVLTNTFENSQALQTWLLILFLAISLFFFYRFAFKSFELTNFYFALFLVCYSYRLIGADLYLLHHWIDDYPWLLGVKLEYISLFSSSLFFSLYVFHLLKEEASKKMLRPLLIICSGLIILVIFTPVSIFSQTIPYYFVVLTFYIAYGFYLFTSAAISERKGATYGILSVSVVFAIFIYQMFYYMGWLEYVYFITFIAHFLFSVFQSMQLYILTEHNLKKDIRLKSVSLE